MSTKTIADLRDILFKTLDELADHAREPDYKRIAATCEVAQVAVSTARAQIEYYKLIHGDGNLKFLEEPSDEESTSLIAKKSKSEPPNGSPAPSHPWRGGVMVHRLER